MVLSKVARLANASGIARSVSMLTVSRQLTVSHSVVAPLAKTFGVKGLISVNTVRDLSPTYFLLFVLLDATG